MFWVGLWLMLWWRFCGWLAGWLAGAGAATPLGAWKRLVLAKSARFFNTLLLNPMASLLFAIGMNAFLKNLEITFRRDPTNFRPRINKKESTKDREQKLAGTYYYL